jgi:hypothetical protein
VTAQDDLTRQLVDAGVALLRNRVEAGDGEGAAMALDALRGTDPQLADRLLAELVQGFAATVGQ